LLNFSTKMEFEDICVLSCEGKNCIISRTKVLDKNLKLEWVELIFDNQR